jgi:4-hydroxythreonine-4-phosphate dehydrogenase
VPPPRIAIVADDLTGAADTAGGLVEMGLPWVTWGHGDANVAWQDDDRIVSVDAGTRHLPAAAAAESVRNLARHFRLAGFTHLYKKVDSTLRGHVAVEVRAAREGWHPAALAVIAPAFPAMGRTTVDGRQWIGNEPLDCPALIDMFASAGVAATAVSLAEVRSGSLNHIFGARRKASSANAVVCDAVTDSDLAAIAAACAALGERVVWVGSGGLARNMVTVFRPHLEQASTAVAASGPVLIVCGSLSTISSAQTARVFNEGVCRVSVSAGALSGGAAAAHRAAAEILQNLRDGVDVLVTIQADRDKRTIADPELVERLGQMLASCRTLVGGLVATGGDTASAVLRHWGVTGLRLVGEAQAGVPIGIATGSPPLVVALKAGAFGDAATLALARSAVRSLLGCRPAS